MTDPPPEVVPREYWEIWYAACKLLEENAGLTILDVVSDNGDDGWHNSGHEYQERASRKAREASA